MKKLFAAAALISCLYGDVEVTEISRPTKVSAIVVDSSKASKVIVLPQGEEIFEVAIVKKKKEDFPVFLRFENAILQDTGEDHFQIGADLKTVSLIRAEGVWYILGFVR